MKLSSMFPTGNTLAKPKAKQEAAKLAAPAAKGLAAVIQKPTKKPGEFKITWPKFKTQQPKDYGVITTVAQLEAYIDKCETTGLGGFDYETAADEKVRQELQQARKEYAIQLLAIEEEPDEKARTKARDALTKKHDAQVAELKKTPLDPHKADICAMSLAAGPDEARAIFISHKKGRRLFEPQLDRHEARKLVMDTLERRFFTNKKIMKIAVNLAFETKFTSKYGKYILMPVADPLVMWVRVQQLVVPHKIKDPKRPTSGKGLKPMTKEVFGVMMGEFTEVLAKHGADFFDEVDADSQDALIYCCEDSDYAVQHYLYWDEIAQQIENHNDIYKTYSDWLHNIEMPFSRVIGLMEYQGMYWDNNLSEVKRQEAEIMQEQAAEEIKRIARETFQLEVNPGKTGKTNEVKSVLFDYMKVPAAEWGKTGPSLDGNALLDMIFMLENKLQSLDEEKYLAVDLPEGWEALDPETDVNLDKGQRQRIRIERREEHPYRYQAVELLGYLQKIQKYTTLLSSHIVGRETYLNERTNRIHAGYTPWTETARLNSMKPNGQNVPRIDNDEFGIRNFYRAPDGRVLFLIDYSGFELRLIAWKSSDETMIDIFLNGGDMHRKTAATLTNKPEEEVTKHERSDAKAGNFGITYGGTEHALQKTYKKYGIRKSLDACLAVVNAVKNTYKRITEYQRNAILWSRETGYAETIYGYKRLLPNINSSSGKSRGEDERRAGNTPIQGSAAEIMKASQNGVYEKIGLDTAYHNIGERVEVAENFIGKAKEMLEGPVVMKHGVTDMIAQIHDEIIFEMNDDLDVVKAAGAWVKEYMELEPLPGFPIPIEAEASAAYSWGNKKDLGDWVKEKGVS